MPPSIFQNFESELQSEMNSKCSVTSIPEGSILINYQQTIQTIPILISGSIKVLRLNADGHELLLYYLTSGESCALSFTCCMQSKFSSVKAVAEEDTEVLQIPIELIDKWMAQFPKFRSYVMQTIQNRMDELMKTIDQVAFHRLDERLVLYLKEKQKVTNSAVLQLSHEQIAIELATSRVVISRLLKRLELDKKVVLYRNEIKILSGL